MSLKAITQRFLTKSSPHLQEKKTLEAAHFSGKFTDWKLANLLKKNTTSLIFQEQSDLIKLHVKFENSRNTFSPKNPQINASLLKAIVWELRYTFFFSFVLGFCKICKLNDYYLWKYKYYRSWVRNLASGMLQSGHKLEKWQWSHNLLIIRLVNFAVFLLSSLVTALSFIWISLLVLRRSYDIFVYEGLTRNP